MAQDPLHALDVDESTFHADDCEQVPRLYGGIKKQHLSEAFFAFGIYNFTLRHCCTN